MRQKIGRYALIFGLMLVFIVGWLTKVYSETTQSALAKSVIRFHVLANSDSEEDQALKVRVKDEVLSHLKPELSAAQSVDETRLLIESKLSDIQSHANAVVQACGYDYTVTATLSQDFFPTKNYGDITFFPGEYEALRIVIGEGEGQNWWCVMFPPLCYMDVTEGKIPEDDKRVVENLVQYKMIFDDTREKKPTVNIKFKIVEWWQNKHKKDKDKTNEKKLDGYVLKSRMGSEEK